EVPLEAPGEDELAQLAPETGVALALVRRFDPFGAGEDRFRGLLRERRAPDGPVVFDVRPVQASREPAEAHAAVVEELGVLAGDERLLQLLRDRLVRHHLAALVVELAD